MIRRPPTLAGNGLIVASHPLAAAAGLAQLEAGGHAVDAIVAAAAVLSVVEPGASGLGGDAFFLVYEAKDRSVRALHGQGAAPQGLGPERFAGLANIPLRGAATVTVPGCVSAWGKAWSQWGRLDWSDLIAPAAALAERGFPVSWRLARVLRRERQALAADPGLAQLFLREDGAPLATGDTCRPSALGGTLELLADNGAEAFYSAPVWERLCRALRARGGVLTENDLFLHQPEALPPLELRGPAAGEAAGGSSGEIAFYEQPLATQGILLLIMLGLLLEHDVRRGAGASADRGWDELHRQVEATKIALALRGAFLADPRYLPVPEGEVVSALLAPETLRALSGLFEGEPLVPGLASDTVLALLEKEDTPLRGVLGAYREAGYDPGARDGAPGGSDTTYLCATDREGNAVGLIQSIYQPFGCGILDPESGIILNDRAAGFSLHPRSVNRLEPGKRPLHTLNSYMILKDRRPWLIGGTPGADHQVQTNLQVIRHVLGGRVSWSGPGPMRPGKWTQARLAAPAPPLSELLAEALEAPRWGLESNGDLRTEARLPAEVRRRLRRMGHRVVRVGPWDGSGFVQAIQVLEGDVFLGATDPRGEGVALGW
jgi:gamma-glutamyltranspeptidase / glutathione hydrolase